MNGMNMNGMLGVPGSVKISLNQVVDGISSLVLQNMDSLKSAMTSTASSATINTAYGQAKSLPAQLAIIIPSLQVSGSPDVAAATSAITTLAGDVVAASGTTVGGSQITQTIFDAANALTLTAKSAAYASAVQLSGDIQTNGCPGTQANIISFQTIYKNSTYSNSAGLIANGVYDATCQAAVNEVLGTSTAPAACVSVTPAPSPSLPPTSTTTTTTTVSTQAPTNTAIIVGVVAVSGLAVGALAYMMAKYAKK